MNIAFGSWGPFTSMDELKDTIPNDDLSQIQASDELFRYDAYSISIARGMDRLWLIHNFEHNLSKGEAGQPRRDAFTAHHLCYSCDEDTLRASLHDGFVPTSETYNLAEAIYRSEFSYDYDEAAKNSSNFLYTCREVKADIATVDEIIDTNQYPGNRIVFSGLSQKSDGLPLESFLQYNYPVPQDEVLAFYDCPRIWIGSFPKNPNKFHLVVCISDERGKPYIQHRLDFATAQKDAVLATLASDVAPTMDTYRLAKEVWIETQTDHDDETWSLEVDKIDINSDGWCRPPWENTAAYHADLDATISGSSVNIT